MPDVDLAVRDAGWMDRRVDEAPLTSRLVLSGPSSALGRLSGPGKDGTVLPGARADTYSKAGAAIGPRGEITLLAQESPPPPKAPNACF